MKKLLFLIINLLTMFALNSAQISLNPAATLLKTEQRMTLREAIDIEDLDAMQKAFEQTGDINDYQSFTNDSVLMYAIQNKKSLKVIKFLVHHGANISHSNFGGATAFSHAIHNARLDVLICLLNNLGKNGQNVDPNFIYYIVGVGVIFNHNSILNSFINTYIKMYADNALIYKKMKYVFERYLEFKNEDKALRLKNLSENIYNALEFMPKELTNIIAGYAEPTFEEYLGNSYENIKE